MRKQFLKLILLLVFSNAALGSSVGCGDCATVCKEGSKSFLMPRAVIEDVSLYLGLNNYQLYRKHYGLHNGSPDDQRIHVVRGLFYQHSLKGDKIGSYFLPNDKNTINIKENVAGSDVNSLWLDVITPIGDTYSSTLTLCPSRMIWGGYFSYHQDFDCGSWLEFDFAVYEAKHHLNPRQVLTGEKVLGNIPGAATALQYLSSNALDYGRITSYKSERIGFDDILAKFGYDHFFECIDGHLGGYLTTILPISSRPIGKQMFEAVVGRSHWGLGAGINTAYKIYETSNRALMWMADFRYEYLFKNHQIRSFDLTKNGNWSRYMRGATEAEPAQTFPLIDVLTQDVAVTPRGTINFWTALHLQHCKWHAEVGYNLWFKQAEKICYTPTKCGANCFYGSAYQGNVTLANNVGVFDIANACNPTTASAARINSTTESAISDPTFTPITVSDINLSSGGTPSVLTNKFYLAGAYDFTFWHRPFNIGLSASYEFGSTKGAINQWGFWGNINCEF